MNLDKVNSHKYSNKWFCIYLYEVVYCIRKVFHFRQVGSNYWKSSEINLWSSRAGVRLSKELSSCSVVTLLLSLTLPYFMHIVLWFTLFLGVLGVLFCFFFNSVCSSFCVLSFLCCFSPVFSHLCSPPHCSSSYFFSPSISHSYWLSY